MSSSNKNPIKQNFGGQWIDDVRRFLLTNADGCTLDELQAKFLMEMNIFPPKSEEIIGYYQRFGFLIRKDGIYKWNNKLNIEIKPYKKVDMEIEEKPKKNKKVSELINDGERDRSLYKIYLADCKKQKEKPITYDEWLNEKYKEKEGI